MLWFSCLAWNGALPIFSSRPVEMLWNRHPVLVFPWAKQGSRPSLECPYSWIAQFYDAPHSLCTSLTFFSLFIHDFPESPIFLFQDQVLLKYFFSICDQISGCWWSEECTRQLVPYVAGSPLERLNIYIHDSDRHCYCLWGTILI